MSNHDGRRAHDWIAPLMPAIAAVSSADLAMLERFEGDLTGLLAAYPVDAGVEPVLRSQRLQKIREATAASEYLALSVPPRLGGSGRPAIVQALMQFVCGYYDVDLRDSTGLGHGRLIADHASASVRDLWVPRLLDGAVPGIAITEPHGGSQVHATRTRATLAPDGTRTVTGMKTWISRLTEAAVFCLFFADPDGKIYLKGGTRWPAAR